MPTVPKTPTDVKQEAQPIFDAPLNCPLPSESGILNPKRQRYAVLCCAVQKPSNPQPLAAFLL
jgi:hypothetical protein